MSSAVKNSIVDYGDDRYHQVRHRDPERNSSLYDAWSEYASSVYFPSGLKNSKILEVGAAYGYNLYHLSRSNSCYAVEPSSAARLVANSRGLRCYPSISDIPPGSKFDYILLRHVLEHVLAPVEFLVELFSLLEEAGKIIVILPCEKSVEAPSLHEIDYHLYCWNARTFANLVRAIGCSIEIESCRINHFNCRRILLPVRRFLGPLAYRLAIDAAGRLFPGRELVVTLKHNS